LANLEGLASKTTDGDLNIGAGKLWRKEYRRNITAVVVKRCLFPQKKKGHSARGP